METMSTHERPARPGSQPPHTTVPSAEPLSADASEADSAQAFAFRLSPMAAQKVAEALAKRGTPDAALRVGVKGGGCSGYSYVIEFADKPPTSRDLVFSYPVSGRDEPVRVLCDKKSILYLNGTILDWEKTLMYQGFKFKNPQVTSTCGCNTSFSV